MFRLTRHVTASVALVAMAWNTYAVEPPDAVVEQRKREAATAIGDATGCEEAAARAGAIFDVRFSGDGTRAKAVVHIKGDVLWDVFTLDEGRRIVLDLHNTVNLLPQRSAIPSDRRLVRQIRNSHYASEPLYVSRVVFDAAHPLFVTVDESDETITLDLNIQTEASGNPFGQDDATAMEARSARKAMIAEREAFEMANRQNHNDLEGSIRSELAHWADTDEFQPFAMTAVFRVETDTLYPTLNQMLDFFSEDKADSTTPEAVEMAEIEVASPVFQSIDLAQIDLRFTEIGKLATTASPLPHESRPERSVLAERQEPVRQSELHPDVVDADLDAEPIQEEAVLSAPMTAPEEPPAEPIRRAVSIPTSRGVTTPHGMATDPLYQPVIIDFRDMELSNVVALLAQKAEINVIAGPEVSLTTPVTAYLQNVPLMTAMETVLRMSDLGIVEEEGIFRIVTYGEALEARRTTKMIYLHKAQVQDLQTTLNSVAGGMPDGRLVTVTANETTNVLILSGPQERVAELEELAHQLDVAEPVLPTVTQVIKMNYSEPIEVLSLVEGMLTPDVGHVEIDTRSRHVIVTDMPMVIEQIQELLEEIDLPVKQVAIEAMIVDAVLRDSSQTGVTWLLDLVRKRDRQGDIIGILDNRRTPQGDVHGSVRDLNMQSSLGNIGADTLDAGILSFGVLTGSFDFRGAIAAEAASTNAEILANPVVVTIENREANISIVQEFPYQQITQSTQGPPVATTAFKEIGIELRVTPRVTHNDEIMVDLSAKQSSISGLTPDGIPIEDKRVAETSLLTSNGRTIFLGGLRDISSRHDISKVPVLGDVPVLNFLFRTTDVQKIHTELMIFLTCNVIQDVLPTLEPAQQVEFDKIQDVPDVPDAQREMFRSIVRPGEIRDPIWKWRRTP